jgi:hypothetical protein
MSRQTPFQTKHVLEYGRKIVKRSPSGSVETVQSQFCVFFGRETREGAGVKRKRTKNVQLFQFPFRPENYGNHLKSQHSDDWAKYQALSFQAKLSFFNQREVSGIHAFLDKENYSLEFTIFQPAIVDSLIGDPFFNPSQDEEDDDSTPVMKANAMKLFKLLEDGSYRVTIKNPLRFQLAIDHISVGLSFRQTAAVITQHRNRCNNPKLAGLSDHVVGQFVRVLVAVSLQLISNVIANRSVWAFLLAADASTHLGVPMLDQRVRICFNGVLLNLHLVFFPFFERHTATNYVKLITTILDCMHSSWRDKVISISSDGESTMTGRNGGVVTLLDRDFTNPIPRIWCGPYQLDLIIKHATHDIMDRTFYKTAHSLSVHLRAQQTLITDMGSKCPKNTTRWVAFGGILKWKITHYRRLRQYVNEKRSVQAPSNSWWVIAAALSTLYDSINITLTTIQARDLIISQQRQEVSKLFANICAGIRIHTRIVDSLDGVDLLTVVSNGGWWITKNDILEHIKDQGSWVRGFVTYSSNCLIQKSPKFCTRLVNSRYRLWQRARRCRQNAIVTTMPALWRRRL